MSKDSHPLPRIVPLRRVKTKTPKPIELMTRVKRGTVARKRRNKILELNRGFRGSHSTLFRTANQRSLKALSSSYSDRRKKKRQYRRLWIRRINAGSRPAGLTYSRFMHYLKVHCVVLNRKMLSQLVILHPTSFTTLTRRVQTV
jgi:large subunit ribosomal protein L20